MWLFKSKRQIQTNEKELLQATGVVLADTSEAIKDKATINIPIDSLAALGVGISSLLPSFRTITQTVTQNTTGLYKIANAGIGDTLKLTKSGNFWGALKTSAGTSKLAQLQTAGPITATTTTVMPISPAPLLMAATLYMIEQKLDDIADTTKHILAFLETEKESEIEADVETINSIMAKYKHNWDNDQFIASNYKAALELQRNARKHINSYGKYITDTLNSKNIFVSHAKVNQTLKELLKKFKYYRMSIYVFAMSSLAELLLSGDFKEENIVLIKDELIQVTKKYADLYAKSSERLEKLSESSVKTNILKGFGKTSETVGKAIGRVPVISQGLVDEFLQEKGQEMKNTALDIEQQTVDEFTQVSDTGVENITETMDYLIKIYNHTSDIYFDDKEIYIIAE